MIDETCQNIIRSFEWPRGESCDLQSRPSIYKISKTLGIHPLTIKKKINEMFSMGIIRNIRYYIDDRFNEWNRYFVLIYNNTKIVEIISGAFQSLPYVERVSYGHLTDRNLNDIGFFAGISLICKTESDLNRKIRQLSELIPDIDKFYLIMKENDEKKTPLDSTDITIVKSMIKQNPLNFNINKIHHETGIPLRTVRRRVEKLLERDAIYEEISFDTGKLEQGIMPSIIVKSSPELNMNTLRNMHFSDKKWLIMKKYGDFIFMIYHVRNFNELGTLSTEFSKVTEDFMISYRNGSFNNPHVKYF
ncbi:MAG: hypothetical protein ACYCUZ_05195 [Cuniculiplasma sp.]|jgi:DNA-binding Lrp family transcriptional regulator